MCIYISNNNHSILLLINYNLCYMGCCNSSDSHSEYSDSEHEQHTSSSSDSEHEHKYKDKSKHESESESEHEDEYLPTPLAFTDSNAHYTSNDYTTTQDFIDGAKVSGATIVKGGLIGPDGRFVNNKELNQNNDIFNLDWNLYHMINESISAEIHIKLKYRRSLSELVNFIAQFTVKTTVSEMNQVLKQCGIISSQQHSKNNPKTKHQQVALVTNHFKDKWKDMLSAMKQMYIKHQLSNFKYRPYPRMEFTDISPIF